MAEQKAKDLSRCSPRSKRCVFEPTVTLLSAKTFNIYSIGSNTEKVKKNMAHFKEVCLIMCLLLLVQLRQTAFGGFAVEVGEVFARLVHCFDHYVKGHFSA